MVTSIEHKKAHHLSDAQIERGWRDTFSTNNPFCPCNLKTFTKAARWAEAQLRAELDRLHAEVQRLTIAEWEEGSRFNMMALDRPELPAREKYRNNSDYLRDCRVIVDAHMRSVAKVPTP
jgi:hypothetical protein